MWGYYLIAEEAGRPEGRERERAGREATRSDPEEGGEAAGTRRGGGQDY